MSKPEKIYKDVIMVIDSNRDLDNKPTPFAIWEIAALVNHSRTQVSRILRHLIYLGFLFKLRTGFANRVYKITKIWGSLDHVIKQYELYRFVKGRNI